MLQVFPSLSLYARVASSSWKANEQILSVELTNNRTDRPTDLYLTLDKLALASRKYKLEVIPGQFGTSDQVANVLQIGWQERLTVHYRALPLEPDNALAQLSECSFKDDAVASRRQCAGSNALDFLCLERASKTFEVSRLRCHPKDLSCVRSHY